ncbi:MAG TPA: replication-associated recombination protein A [Synergistaceae bacterium]|nr:replication-associated recombination protein A [Synergistaceae bacterium]HPJ24876.1 replication-associated recombination protein A [Synergistaceae bacterium]HPQ37099.1 replication-associated recombination protein A [Synergistaceae bacterium]
MDSQELLFGDLPDKPSETEGRDFSGKSIETPLPERMRPRSLKEYVGQKHLLGSQGTLGKILEGGHVPSCILYGPPGVGKTTLVRLLALETGRKLMEINAVTSRVADLREMIELSRKFKASSGRTALAFVDEIYHLNKQQQNVLLPPVEQGDLILIGTTTENPYIEINKTLRSRMMIFELRPLEIEDLVLLFQRALKDSERGLGALEVFPDSEALEALAKKAGGDARQGLIFLEAMASSVAVGGGDRLTLERVETFFPKGNLRFDRQGDDHYQIISALIKSMRGSDPDASIYWLSRLCAAEEDPRFIGRRLVIFAAEDVGLADPRALSVALAAFQACDVVGWPEGRIIFAEAVLYLACAPKSNSAYRAINEGLKEVEQGEFQQVPEHLRAHGEGYRYPHDDPRHWVPQQYMLQPRRFFYPGNQGEEPQITEPLKGFWRRFQEKW